MVMSSEQEHLIDIRLAGEGDLPMLSTIGAVLQPVKTVSYFRRCLAEQEEGKRQVFIARLHGADAGFGILNWHPQYSLYRRLGIPEIQDLNVEPDLRRNGAATALIGYCEEQARKGGAEHVGISVGLHAGFGAAQRLYVRLGYVPDGYGVTYDRQAVTAGEMRPVDDNLCLMMVKDL